LKHDGVFARRVKNAHVVFVQRSRGYTFRRALTVDEIEKIVGVVRAVSSKAIVVVDNCYGEFTEFLEPAAVGADLCVGSLIKNPGGGIAETGGYIVGKRDLIDLCADRLTCAGIGREVGCSLDQNKKILMGLFHAPQAVCNAVKTSAFACELFKRLGYETMPLKDEKRSDIITVLKLGSEEAVVAFCKAIQSASPVDSFVTPEPWFMPGYTSKVIMAAGTFNMGASLELSADAPIKEPYAVWLQGGLTYHTAKLSIMKAATEVLALDNRQ
jgi:cystathionine beta-lyase family protein involved in aluminum resistance